MMTNLFNRAKLLALSLLAVLVLTSCSATTDVGTTTQPDTAAPSTSTTQPAGDKTPAPDTATPDTSEPAVDGGNTGNTGATSFDLSAIPPYSGTPYVAVNDNEPFFTDDEMTDVSFESFSPLDQLGRCGVALASVGVDIMPTEDRESISSVYPTGWEQEKYDWVDGKYLYNRCHIIGFQLTGENANKLNLITGTRQLNVDGMLLFENMVADYVKETENHVYYRVTPIFEGNNLLATGVLMEAKSVEDDGDGVLFNVFCYNAQEGVSLDFATGVSHAAGTSAPVAPTAPPQIDSATAPQGDVSAIDTNGNGQVTIKEAKAAGFQMPITSDHWLYQYMIDGDGDGKVGE